MRGVACLLVALGTAAPPLAAQHSDAEQAVVAVVAHLFDAMRAKDTVALRAVFHESARLASAVTNREGQPVVAEVPIDRFIQAIGGAQPYLDEQVWDTEVRLDGNLATVWTKYAFFADREFSHCGVDAFQLAMTDAGWKIIQIADTRQREGCDLPEHITP